MRSFIKTQTTPLYLDKNYWENRVNTRLDLGYKPTTNDFKIEIKCRTVLWSFYLCQSRASITGSIFWIWWAQWWQKINMTWNGIVTSFPDIDRGTEKIVVITAEWLNWTCTWHIDDLTNDLEYDVTGTYTWAAPTANFCIRWNKWWNYMTSWCRIWYIRMREWWQPVRDMKPVLRIDWTPWFLDVINNEFYTVEAGEMFVE